MTIYLPPWQRHCDCDCLLHRGQIRITYDDPGCACTITCATQPLTLLTDRWDGALFLDSGGDLWFVVGALAGDLSRTGASAAILVVVFSLALVLARGALFEANTRVAVLRTLGVPNRGVA